MFYIIVFNVGFNVGMVNDVIIWCMKNINVVVIINNFVGYQLYQDVGYNIVWGVIVGINIVVGIGIGLLLVYNVYGQIVNFSVNNVVIGSYQDIVIVIIFY